MKDFFLFFALWTSGVTAGVLTLLYTGMQWQKRKKKKQERLEAAKPKPTPEIMEFHKID